MIGGMDTQLLCTALLAANGFSEFVRRTPDRTIESVIAVGFMGFGISVVGILLVLWVNLRLSASLNLGGWYR